MWTRKCNYLQAGMIWNNSRLLITFTFVVCYILTSERPRIENIYFLVFSVRSIHWVWCQSIPSAIRTMSDSSVTCTRVEVIITNEIALSFACRCLSFPLASKVFINSTIRYIAPTLPASVFSINQSHTCHLHNEDRLKWISITF